MKSVFFWFVLNNGTHTFNSYGVCPKSVSLWKPILSASLFGLTDLKLTDVVQQMSRPRIFWKYSL